MSEWFHAKVKFLRQMDNGLIKQITEQYLVDSMSFTETEARVMGEVGEGMREVTMMAVARSPIKEVVFYGDTDLWFKVKVQYSLMDEETEKEKKITTYLLVNANDLKESYERTEEHLKEMLVPFRITKAEESPIIDIFEYQKAAPSGFRRMSSTETTGRTDRRAEQLVNAGGMAIGVRGVLVNRKGDEKPLSFAETATDAEWDGFLDGTEALIESKIGNGPAIVGKQEAYSAEFHAEGDEFEDGNQSIEDEEECGFEERDSVELHHIMPFPAEKPAFEHYRDAVNGTLRRISNQTALPLQMVGPIDTMGVDQIYGNKIEVMAPYANVIDPTAGQAIGYDAGIVEMLSELGLENLTLTQIEELTDKAKTLSMIDFCGWFPYQIQRSEDVWWKLNE